jgi:ribose 1,5-bisphosphokinase
MKNRLIYVMGASGSGKDSLLCYAREHLAGYPWILFAHRYITRRADASGENHISLFPEEFAARTAAGLFALHWQSHGRHYGIGCEIDQWLARGMTVIVNGSRAHLPQAVSRYRNKLLPLLIEVSAKVLRERLLRRGRETPEQIARRLERHRELADTCKGCLRINNNGQLQEAGEQLIRLILDYSLNDGTK